MAVVTSIEIEVQIPHEPGESMTFRKLGWKQLQKARDLRSREGLETLKAMGPEMQRAMADAQNTGATEAALRDPANRYDRATLLQAGIVRWSYREKCNPANIDALDPMTAEWAFRELVALNDPQETEDARGND